MLWEVWMWSKDHSSYLTPKHNLLLVLASDSQFTTTVGWLPQPRRDPEMDRKVNPAACRQSVADINFILKKTIVSTGSLVGFTDRCRLHIWNISAVHPAAGAVMDTVFP